MHSLGRFLNLSSLVGALGQSKYTKSDSDQSESTLLASTWKLILGEINRPFMTKYIFIIVKILNLKKLWNYFRTVLGIETWDFASIGVLNLYKLIS